MAGLAEAASVIAVVQAADRVLYLCGKYAAAAKDTNDEIGRLVNQVKALRDVLTRVNNLASTGGMKLHTSDSALEEFAGSIKEINSVLNKLEIELGQGKGGKIMSHFGVQALKWPFGRQDVVKIIEELNRHNVRIIATLNLVQIDNNELAEQNRQIDKLPYADDATYNSRLWDQKSRCLKGTRVELLHLVKTWSESPQSACIFWLNGMAGTGKSTIARTVARNFAKQKRLGASFFFSRGRGDLGYAKKFFTTIAAQLAKNVPLLKCHTSRAMSKNPQIIGGDLAKQWRYLISSPLSLLGETSLESQIFILVIDALDECESEDDIRLILRLLTETKTADRVKLRVFITSRPETPIRFGFGRMSQDVHQDLALHDIDEEITQQDISFFLSHELEDIRKEYNIRQGWPDNDDIQLLALRASGLFIYAATACRFLRSSKYSPPEDQLALLLKGSTTSKSPDGVVDKIYTQVLEHSVMGDSEEQEREELAKQFREIVGSIIILFDTLAAASLAQLIDNSERSVLAILSNLHSVLYIRASQVHSIQLLHPSFRDFLTNPNRCLDPQFWIDEKATHGNIFLKCIILMSKHFQNQDICGLQLPGTLITEVDKSTVDRHIPPHVQYACRHWVDHLIHSNVTDTNLSETHTFIQKTFLYWLEALSLLGKVSDSIQMMTNLHSLVVGKNLSWHELIRDARRFILHNQPTIEAAPLQIYSSALVFTPENSLIRANFKDQIPYWIRRLPRVKQYWSPLEQTFIGHSGWIRSVAFSPDGSKLASGSVDYTARIWNVATRQVEHTLKNHSDRVTSVMFSPDGSKLASGSHDHTVRIWNVATGQVEQTLKGHSGQIMSVAFSPDDNNKLASGSWDSTIRIWNVITGQVEQTLEDHLDEVRSIVFSPDGTKLASGSSDNTVRIWNVTTGKKQTLKGHSGSITSVEFSPDGTKLVSGSADRTVRVWNVATWQVEQIFKTYFDIVSSLVFSPDGSKLASGSEGTAQIWNVATGEMDQTLKHHLNRMRYIAFSPDGSKLVAGSDDPIVRVWNVTPEQMEQTLENHSDWVRSIVFSPDGSKLASGSDDHTVRIWNMTTGQIEQTLKGHSDRVLSLVFSPDSSKLVSWSSDRTLRIWNVATGQVKQTLKSDSSWIWSIVFSPDGSKLASGSDDCIVRIWDVATGEMEQTLKDHSDWTRSIVFSPDGSKLASGSDDGTVRVWNVTTGKIEQTLENHSDWIRSMLSSPDSSKLDLPYSVDTSNCWVTQNGSRILHLPVDYRPGHVAVKDSTLAIGARTGWVGILTFCSDINEGIS